MESTLVKLWPFCCFPPGCSVSHGQRMGLSEHGALQMHTIATSTLKAILCVTIQMARVVLTLFHAEKKGDLCLTLAEIQSTKFTFGPTEMYPEEQMETCSAFVEGVAVGHLLSPEAHHFHAPVVTMVW